MGILTHETLTYLKKLIKDEEEGKVRVVCIAHKIDFEDHYSDQGVNVTIQLNVRDIK